MKAYSLGVYEKAMPPSLDWEQKLEAAGKAGFDFVEMSIDETDTKLKRLDMSEEEREYIRESIRKTGIPIRTICLSAHRKYPLGSSNVKTNRKSMQIMEKAICLAEDLGVTAIQLAGYDVYYEMSTTETIQRFESNLKKAVLMAAKSGVYLGFETMETEFINTVQKAMTYVHKTKSAYLGVYPDSGNITNAAKLYGTDVLKDIKTGEGHIIAMHLKETLPGKYREVPFGKGHVDFEEIIKSAWKIGVRRYVTEFWYNGSSDWEAQLYLAHDKMSGVLDKVGSQNCRCFCE